MTQQFTAIEVRDHARELQTQDEPQIEAAHMLTTFADLLEAREKAVPVGYISADDIRELDANREDDAECAEAIEMLIASRPFASNHTAIYTHPAPPDAGRWAEALRKKIKEWRGAYHHITEWDRGRRAGLLAAADYLERLLAAHSAQAQSPADQFDPERNVRPGDVGTEMQTAEQDAADFGAGFEVDGRRVAPERVRIFSGEHAAQPPAASVQDVDVLAQEIRRVDGDHKMGAACLAEHIVQFLAAQENPNG